MYQKGKKKPTLFKEEMKKECHQAWPPLDLRNFGGKFSSKIPSIQRSPLTMERLLQSSICPPLD
jgi:hypothetical protein